MGRFGEPAEPRRGSAHRCQRREAARVAAADRMRQAVSDESKHDMPAGVFHLDASGTTGVS